MAKVPLPKIPNVFVYWRRGALLALRSAAVGLPVTLLFNLFGLLGVEFVIGLLKDARSYDPANIALVWQGCSVVALFLVLYLVVQIGKRREATAASWFPTLFLAPAVFFGGAWYFVSLSGTGPVGPGPMIFLVFAFNLLYQSVFGAVCAIGVIRAGHAAHEGTPVPVGAVLSEMATRAVPVAVAHGAYIHFYLIGMQILLPGIFAQVQLALTDMVAVLEPKAGALARSRKLTAPVRGRVFRLYFIGAILWIVVQTAIVIPIEGQQAFFSSFIDPSVPSLKLRILTGLVVGVVLWVEQLAYLEFYYDRVEREQLILGQRDAIADDVLTPTPS